MGKKLIAVLALVVGAMIAMVGVDSSLTPADAGDQCVPSALNNWCYEPGVGSPCDEDYVPPRSQNGDDPQYNWKLCPPPKSLDAITAAPVEPVITEAPTVDERQG